jgi:hypothetical protein
MSDWAIPLVAGLFFLASLYFFGRGLASRRSVAAYDYGVARQEARQAMAVSYVRGFMVLLVGLIIFGIYGMTNREPPSGAPAAPVLTTPVPSPATEEAPTEEPSPTPTAASFQQLLPTPTDAPEEVVPEVTEEPTPTPTPDVQTAVVNSPNGLWLREAPGGTQELELIPDGTVLELLPGRETEGDLEWQQVRTPSGNEGWVAVAFIIYQ